MFSLGIDSFWTVVAVNSSSGSTASQLLNLELEMNGQLVGLYNF